MQDKRDTCERTNLLCSTKLGVYIAMIYIHMVVYILSYVWPFVCI